MSPRIGLTVLLCIGLLTAGCPSGPGVDQPPSPASDTPIPGTPTASIDTTAGTRDATTPSPRPDVSELSEIPQPQAVEIENRWNRSVEIDVRVVRQATDETVHDGTYRLPPQTDREVFDTASVDTDGVESFTVVLTARNSTERVTFETSKCHGGVYGGVSDDGSLDLTYAIC